MRIALLVLLALLLAGCGPTVTVVVVTQTPTPAPLPTSTPIPPTATPLGPLPTVAAQLNPFQVAALISDRHTAHYGLATLEARVNPAATLLPYWYSAPRLTALYEQPDPDAPILCEVETDGTELPAFYRYGEWIYTTTLDCQGWAHTMMLEPAD